MKLPPLHLACSQDEIKPVFNHVLITKEHVVATDAHILIVHDTERLFFQSDITAILTDVQYFLHYKAWQELTKEFKHLEITDHSIVIYRANYIQEIMFSKADLKYPNYKEVIPETPVELSEIGIDSKLIDIAGKCLKLPGEYDKFKFTFYGKDNAIKMNLSHYKSFAVIMPCIVE